MAEQDQSPWYEILHDLLETDVDDQEVIKFIEDHVPTESNILDYKSDMYIDANSGHHTRRRQSELIQYFSAFHNAVHPSNHRYLFIGFNSNGEFQGIQYRGDRDGDHVLDVDIVRIENILDPENIEPVPVFEFFELEVHDDRGGVFVIKKGELPPSVVQTTLRQEDGSEFIAKGQSYTRDGSETVLMANSEYRDLIENREQLINDKLEEMADSLGQVVGITSDQLAEVDLTVSPKSEGIPVQDVLTTEAVSEADDRLTSLVKSWNSTGELIQFRPTIYEFYSERDELNYSDEKAEFLLRSSLCHYLTGGEWLLQYHGDIEAMANRIIDEDYNEYAIRNLEHILLIYQKRDILQQIADDSNLRYRRSKAARYCDLCDGTLIGRLSEYIGSSVRVIDDHYEVEDLLENPDQADELLSDIVSELRETDSSRNRTSLRKLELVRIGSAYQES